nr:ribonuclease H-like domain-containing protein [Tanacetum cinerariifolium]
MFLSQKKYSIEILKRASMVNFNPSRTPIDTKSKLGATGDMVSDPTLSESCRILRYVRGTLDYGLQLFSSSTTNLVAYLDADWAGCPTTRSAKAKNHGVANAVAETCWLRNLLFELHTPLSSATLINCDNISAVYLSCNPVQHQCRKHIEIDIHFVRELVIYGHVRVPHVLSCYQYVDIFTKGFDEIEEFFLWMLSCQALNNPCQHKLKHYVKFGARGVLANHLRRESKYVLFVLRKYESEDPNRDGECGFDYLTSTLVSLKAHHKGCRATRMSTKNALVIQRYELLRKELDDFLSSNSIPSEYRVILPTPTQTVLDSPRGYIGLYTYFFSLATLRLPLNDFFCELLLKENMLGVKSFKDKLPSGIEQNPRFQSLARYPISVCAFNDPILFLAVLQSSWEHGQQNFIYTEDDEDLTFLPKDFSPGFNIGSPSVSINAEPVRADEEPTVDPTTEHEHVNKRVGITTDFGGSPKGDTFVVQVVSVAARIRERKCKTRRDSSMPPVKRKVASGSSTSRTVRANASTLKDDTSVLSIYEDDKGLKDYLDLKDATAYNHLDLDLLDLPDRCYARQAVVDNVVNRRLRKLLDVIEKLRGEAYVVLLLREKMSLLAAEAKEQKENLDRLMHESQKWSGYQLSLLDMESKVASLEAKKANLEAIDASLCQEIEKVKHDKREVVSKVVHYACMELLYSDELGRLVGKLASSAITFGRSKKPLTLQKPVPLRTQMPVPSSQLVTPSSAPALKPMYPPANIVKPYPS